MVGGAAPAGEAEGGASAVLIVGSRGNSCTGAAVARDVVLTAAHCVAPGADYKLVEFDLARRPTLKDVRAVVRHPQFSAAAFAAHRATADLALIKLAAPLPGRFMPAVVSAQPSPTQAGREFLVVGFGVTVHGDGRSGGTLRAARLAATGRPGTLQLRLMDPATRGKAAGLGACTGDSGAPVFTPEAGGLAIIGVVSWSTGPDNGAGCGGLTGVTPLARYRDWLMQAARRLGSPLE